MRSAKHYKILCLVAHRPGRSPGQRFRFEQYLTYLEQHGFKCTISYLLNEHDDRIFYSRNNFRKKFLIFQKARRTRQRDLQNLKDYHAVFIYREAMMHGSVFFEKKISESGIPVIYDFDDAIWLFDVSENNKKFGWLKRPQKTSEIIGLSSLTIVGNSYLANYASRFSNSVRIIPTTIDTAYYQNPSVRNDKTKICIGWTGSSTTLKHFGLSVPVLKKISDKYPGKITVKLISDVKYETDEIDYQFCHWNKENEVEDLMDIDIGIMPLPDDEWAKGKCGFKGLQYMSLEIPAIMSPVGVNNSIIKDGENGFLAATEKEWIEKLSLLIESDDLRKTIGKAGRKTVEEKYSFEANKHKWLEAFQAVVDGNT